MFRGCPGAALVLAAAALLIPGADALGVASRARARNRARARDRAHARSHSHSHGRIHARSNEGHSQERFSSSLPVVYVQRDFFENLSTIESLDGEKLDRLGESDQTNFSMQSLYGNRICAGEGLFVAKGRAPHEYCRYRNNRTNDSIEGRWHGEFDEYALEKIMLGKWLDSPTRCPDSFEQSCKESADLVVVPSPFVSVALELGWKWKNIWSLDQESFAKYWSLVYGRYFRSGRSPLVVVHMPYCLAKPDFLRALMEQPPAFVSRVVIAGIESNVQTTERSLFGNGWSGSALAQLRRRAKRRADPGAQPLAEPLLFALPYPTSVLSAASFTHTDYVASFMAKAKRKIEVSFTGNLSKSSSLNWVRTLVHRKVSEVGGESSKMMVNSSILCPGYNNSKRPHCGLGRGFTMWDVVADSTFCIEPPGDTPTRSHFYIAAQSGCVPVLFNGGHAAYEENEPAWFAWRQSPTQPGEEGLLPQSIENLFQDPNKLAVVFNSTDLRDGKVDVVKELLDMQSTNPKRLMHLRRSLELAAPLMTFSSQAPGIWLPGCGDDVRPADAFEAFQGVMLWEAWSRRQNRNGTIIANGVGGTWC